MKTLINILSFVTIAAFASSCNKVKVDGPVRTETRSEQGFDGIRSDVPAEIIYTPGSGYGIEISAQQAILDHLETSVNSGELKFYFSGAYNFSRHDGITIRVTAPELVSAYVNGSGSIRGPQLDLGEKSFTAKVNGSGAVDFPTVSCSSFNSDISGSGKIRIGGGRATKASHKISGSGNIDCRSLESADARAEIQGSGTIRIRANETLDAHISGSGNIYYRGNPHISSHISGSGNLRSE
jgi:hypothetical protein